MTTIQTLERPIILYFGQNEKGLISRLDTGKFVFKHRNSNFKAGFVKVTKLHQQEQYCFAEGENIESEPLTSKHVEQMFFKQFSAFSSQPSELKSFNLLKTTDGIDVVVVKFGSWSVSYHVLFIHKDDYIQFFDKEMIERNSSHVTGQYWEPVDVLFEDVFKKLNQQYLLSPLKKVVSRFYTDWLPEMFTQNPLLNKFQLEFESNSITFLDLTEGYELGPRGRIRDFFIRPFLAFSPLIIDTPFFGVEDSKQLLERIIVHNKAMLKWWKEEGLSQIEDETYRQAILFELSKTIYWETI